MTLAKECPMCGAVTKITVDPVQYKNWQDGTLLQDAFPTLTAEQRELVKTGYCHKCQKLIFGG